MVSRSLGNLLPLGGRNSIKRTRNTEESGAEKVDGPLGAGWSPPPAVALELHGGGGRNKGSQYIVGLESKNPQVGEGGNKI